MAEGDNLLGLVGTGAPRHGRSTRRPRAHTASAADKRTRTSSDASSRNGDREATWAAPPSLNRMSTEFAQSRNNLLSADERTPLIGGDRMDNGRSPGNRSHRSISVTATSYDPEALVTPRRPRPSSWKNMLRAPSQMNTPTLRVIDTPNGEAIVVTRPKKKKHPVVRYLSPLWSATHWMALFHLIFINLPLMLVLWPILIAGTLVGTVLLITLPLGAMVWFLVLILARSACRAEIAMQLYFHSPLRSNIPKPVYFTIFKRVKVVAQGPNGVPRPVVEVHDGSHGEVAHPVWERNFLKNGWAMFSDPLSYQCLYHLLVTKAFVTVLSSLIIIVLFPISVGTIVLLPAMLEMIRRFGRWQAGLSVESLQ
ncbi:hypothetical protein FFLO_00103 [Filobasidium floriforme]|uniref:Uncharacterized protein n=1 Tax=Filobasidium floriforme TaxID=5210 RepID=A0A8K0JSA0_9TREE|nr:hypothetical protein FFLO_00103 [Filobasidium floriforme]